jgi:hypothetical protein
MLIGVVVRLNGRRWFEPLQGRGPLISILILETTMSDPFDPSTSTLTDEIKATAEKIRKQIEDSIGGPLTEERRRTISALAEAYRNQMTPEMRKAADAFGSPGLSRSRQSFPDYLAPRPPRCTRVHLDEVQVWNPAWKPGGGPQN